MKTGETAKHHQIFDGYKKGWFGNSGAAKCGNGCKSDPRYEFIHISKVMDRMAKIAWWIDFTVGADNNLWVRAKRTGNISCGVSEFNADGIYDIFKHLRRPSNRINIHWPGQNNE
ncbi:TPA: hypothetical protein I8X97_001360 [Citrobacter freundii]|nr:hypothetical protein [Citrobacter freundii]